MIYGILIGCVICYIIAYYCIKRKNREIVYLQQTVNKFTDFYQLMNHWIELKNSGKSIARYFREQEYYNIAIYGMADMANRLYEDLQETDIKVLYGIDREVCCTGARVENIYSLQEELPKVDVIVVTPFYAYDSIKQDLEKKIECPIISIEEVIWSI